MSPLNRIMSVAKSDRITYTTLFFGKQTITVDSFEEKFNLLKSVIKEDAGGYIYYFQNLMAPNLIMRVSVSDSDLNLLLENKNYFKKELDEVL